MRASSQIQVGIPVQGVWGKEGKLKMMWSISGWRLKEGKKKLSQKYVDNENQLSRWDNSHIHACLFTALYSLTGFIPP